MAPENDSPVAGLECQIGRARFGVATDAVARIVEYRATPLPLTKPWIGGVGLHEGAPLVSVNLRPAKDRPRGGATVKGILLRVPSSPIGWALEVDEVFSFVRATVVATREAGNHRLPRWIQIAHADGGRALGWVDVAAMLAELVQIVEPAA